MNVDPRVEVARDVIALLDAKKLEATRGVYFSASLKRRSRSAQPVDIQRLMNSGNVEHCAVCAKGAMMVAFAMKHGAVSGCVSGRSGRNILVHSYECSEALLGTFAQAALDTIECAFEGFDYMQQFFAIVDNGDRLRVIMQNVIDNGGEFAP